MTAPGPSSTPSSSLRRLPARRGSPTPARLKGSSVTVDHDRAVESSRHRAEPLTDRFELKKLLGAGGMGNVFAAEDRGLGRVVAIKQLREGLEHDVGLRRRFVLEAQVGAQLEHPNIVSLYSFERTATGAPAFAMQLVEGVTLAEYMKLAAEGPAAEREVGGEYSLKERLGTLLGVLDAIHFAHSRGVVHRDLKPENVMLGRYREVYVMDWGIARLVGEAASRALGVGVEDAFGGKDTRSPAMIAALAATLHGGVARRDMPLTKRSGDVEPLQVAEAHGDDDSPEADSATRAGEIVGTPQYMAPEQARGLVDEVGPPADQYALGLILLELATLRRARSTSSGLQALIEAVEGRSGSREDVDANTMAPALAAVLGRALQAKPKDRYPSVEALANDLRSYIRDEPVSVYDEGSARRLVRLAARRPVVTVGALGALFVAAAVLVVVGLTRTASALARHTHDLDATRRVLVTVADRAHRIDTRLSEIGAGVHAIRAATVVSLEHPETRGTLDMTAEPMLAASARAGGTGLGFARPVVSWVGKDTGTPASAQAITLGRLDPWLRETLVASLPAAVLAEPAPVRAAALARGEAELLRCFVALEDGSFVQLPGRALPAGYDARLSPWYRRGVTEPELHWTRPVADVAGKTLRLQAVAAIRAGGHFLGVTGCDLQVSALARELVLDLPGFRRAYLVTKEGKIAASEDLERRVLRPGLDPDDDLDLPSVENATLAARVAAADAGGYFEAPGDTLIVYTRLISPPWTYVAELEASRHFAAR